MIQALRHQIAYSRPERDLPSADCVPKAGCRRPDQSDSSEITAFPALKAKAATAEFATDTQPFALFAINLKPADVEVTAHQHRHHRGFMVPLEPPLASHHSDGNYFSQTATFVGPRLTRLRSNDRFFLCEFPTPSCWSCWHSPRGVPNQRRQQIAPGKSIRSVLPPQRIRSPPTKQKPRKLNTYTARRVSLATIRLRAIFTRC